MNHSTQLRHNYIGIDVSKRTIDACIINAGGFNQYHQFCNEAAGFKQRHQWLMAIEGFSYEHALFCMEHTGIYTRQLVAFLLQRNARIWMESALHLKRSMGMIRGKNDKVDSWRIARYAMVHKDQAKLVVPSQSTLQLIKDLNSNRDRINKSIQSIRVAVREMQRIDKQTGKELAALNKPALQGLLKSKAAIEKRMQELIIADTQLSDLFSLVTSVKGVGLVLATQLLIYTHSFTRMSNPKQLACYCGVAPFMHTSGSSIRGKTGTSNFANMNLKATLHLAALSSCRYVPDLKAYYERKVAAGKPKMSVLNAVRNKILQRIVSVVKRGTPYCTNYPQINLVNS